jgi:hypothetical protein
MPGKRILALWRSLSGGCAPQCVPFFRVCTPRSRNPGSAPGSIASTTINIMTLIAYTQLVCRKLRNASPQMLMFGAVVSYIRIKKFGGLTGICLNNHTSNLLLACIWTRAYMTTRGTQMLVIHSLNLPTKPLTDEQCGLCTTSVLESETALSLCQEDTSL